LRRLPPRRVLTPEVLLKGGLTALQYLGLDGTQVSDVSPLAGLTVLHRLYLDGTRVSDVSPLDHIHDLQIFGVRNS
jgi:internalin A